MSEYGSQAMSERLLRVMMRRPGKSLLAADAANWHYGPTFDANKAIEQHKVFAGLVEKSGAEVLWIEDDGDGLADSMFTHDPSLMTDKGAVILRMGKPLRAAEPELHEKTYRDAGIPILGRIQAPGTVEGGDCIWVDHKTLAIGRGVRSNQAGIEQMQTILAEIGVTVLGFDLPLWQGEEACLHLMSVMSPLAPKLALVHAPLMPAAFYMLLREREYTLIHAPEADFAASNGLNLNVLPVTPNHVIMVSGFPDTKAAMEAHGCKVETFEADALCIACEGGPTCLTRPILREKN
ncbi:arginine deiminase family protein [Neorhizobium sp. JUb45]|uniref:dimethylarginine dimethylaminohydrolase family protein n=1 Tax=unclassified Neorhizobium TaxID=2629175 RepID=UPI00104F825A|nr:arginine deiminase family protein [Neorhizobium sp. JUb45]TCR06192.1 N-dimethylarginine dimethylaminohydrolase [Neorhizobium sp. JUb45]